MEMNEYQVASRSTAMYPNLGQNLTYPVLGLAGETGEVCDKVKKIFRDDAGVVTPARQQALLGELGDVLWYLAQVATELGLNLDQIAEYNLVKLRSRKERGKITGSGDTR